ncbi:MAG TPA: ABC transporter ATP-binding protein [Deltaproteobacteria bacterium]|nr:ABC transporter ATP-binding protein [Deltaproteobacteria bacterium]
MVTIKNLCKSFGKREVLKKLNLEVAEGEIISIIGPSGAGKTTLLRLIAGLEVPDKGEIHINGKLASTPEYILPPYLRNIGFVFQEPALWPHMTVGKNIEFVINEAVKKERREAVRSLLEKAKLDGYENRYPKELSQGEAKRVALLRAIARKPRYMLMDEPLANLDQKLKSDILELIQNTVNKLQTTLIFVTHDGEEAKQLTNLVYMLSNGKLNPI